jgi:tripartite ATP-independent transporter DctM subunit
VSEFSLIDTHHPAPTNQFHRFENLLLTLVLVTMAVVPVIEIFIRGLFRVGIANAPAIVQHLVLVVGMLGAMVAARDSRLLAFSGLQSVLPENVGVWAARFASAIALAVIGVLTVSSYDFVVSESEGDLMLAYGIPVWAVEALMPLGFACIAFRIVWNSAASYGGRVVTLAFSAIIAAPLATLPGSMATGVELGLILLAAILGAPMFIVLGGAALALFSGDGLPLAAVPLSHYQLTTNPSLPAIPLFTLAGYFLAEGGAPQRLVRLFKAVFGPIKGGTALVSVLLTAFFTSFTGASGVTILALGGLLMPLLVGVHYSQRNALGIITSSPALGTLLPPALPLILYAIIARQPIETMFIAGVGPAVVMTILLVGWGIWAGPRDTPRQPWNFREIGAALLAAKWEVALPLMTGASLFTGWVTPVETAALTAAYAFIIEFVIYRDLKITHDLPRIVTECGLLIGGIILILGMALGFTNYVTDAQLPERATEWVSATISSRWVFLLALNCLLLLVGMLMDIFSAIIVVTPLITPIGAAFGIDPIHLGIIFLANMELGFLTPPVGMNLFFASYRFGLPLSEVIRSILPALVVLGTGVLLVTYVPALSTWLPGLLR